MRKSFKQKILSFLLAGVMIAGSLPRASAYGTIGKNLVYAGSMNSVYCRWCNPKFNGISTAGMKYIGDGANSHYHGKHGSCDGRSYYADLVVDGTCKQHRVKIKYRCGYIEDTWSSWHTGLESCNYQSPVMTKAATCTETGVYTSRCSNCSDAKTTIIPTFPHIVESQTVTKPASCLEEGIKEGICDDCEIIMTDTVEKLPHVINTYSYLDETQHIPHCTGNETDPHDLEPEPHSYNWTGNNGVCSAEGCGARAVKVYFDAYRPDGLFLKANVSKSVIAEIGENEPETVSLNGLSTNFPISFYNTAISKSSLYLLDQQTETISVDDEKTCFKIYYNSQNIESCDISWNTGCDTKIDSSAQDFGTEVEAPDISGLEKPDCTFGGWYINKDYSGEPWDFENDTLQGNTTFYAKWIPETSQYIVEHWKQNTKNKEYTLAQSEPLEGNLNQAVAASPKTSLYRGLTVNQAKSVLQGTVEKDEPLVLKVFYDRSDITATVNEEPRIIPSGMTANEMIEFLDLKDATNENLADGVAETREDAEADSFVPDDTIIEDGTNWFTNLSEKIDNGNNESDGKDDSKSAILSATVPVVLPVTMDLDGNITAPTNASIEISPDSGDVVVSDIKVVAGEGWQTASYTDAIYSQADDVQVFALQLRGDSMQEDGTVALSPDNWEIASGQSLPLEMNVKIPKQTAAGNKGKIASVEYTLKLVEESPTDPTVPTDPTDTEQSQIPVSVQVTPDSYQQAYLEGQEFNPVGMTIAVTYKDGHKETKEDGFTVTNGTNLALYKTSVQIVYVENDVKLSCKAPIVVSNGFPVSAVITKEPDKTDYIEGETFDATGMEITVNYDNGALKTVTDGYVVPDGGKLQIGKANVCISYTENGKTVTAYQPVITAKTPSCPSYLVLSKAPDKVSYIEGDNFDTAGMKIIAVYEDNTRKKIDDYTVTDGEDLPNGKSSVNISYEENGRTVTIAQTITTIPSTPVSMIVTKVPTTVEYVEGETFDSAGMEITVTYDNDTTKILTDEFTVTDGTNLQIGKENVNIGYTKNGQTVSTTQPITVVPIYYPESFTVTKAPDKVEYIEGENFDPTGMEITVDYDNGTTKTLSEGYTVTDGENLQPGKDSVTIDYAKNGKMISSTLPITVLATSPVSIAVTKAPGKTDYIEKTHFDPTGMEVTVTYDNSSTKTLTEGYSVIDGENLQEGKENVTITYTENDTTVSTFQPITVVSASPVSLAVTKAPDKVVYMEGEGFDSTGMELTITYNNETTKTIVNGYTVTDGDDLQEGKDSVTITCTENDTTVSTFQPITMESNKSKTPISMQVTLDSYKKEYTEGENFDPSGMTIEVTYGDGHKSIKDAGFVVTDGEALSVGKTDVNIEYSEKEITISCEAPITVFAGESVEPTSVETPNVSR